MSKKMVMANWKMNLLPEEAAALALAIAEGLEQNPPGLNQEVALAIPFPYLLLPELNPVWKVAQKAAQNCHQADAGAFTGEVSPAQLAACGCQLVLAGHSERRTLFGESNQWIGQKVKAILNQGMKAVFCCGEQLPERDAGLHFQTVETQIRESLSDLTRAAFSQVIVAYEPVWAIGTGRNATPEQAQEMHRFIREILAELFGQEAAGATTILYGGSCNPQNARALFSMPDVGGGLVGGASLKASDFLTIIQSLPKE